MKVVNISDADSTKDVEYEIVLCGRRFHRRQKRKRRPEEQLPKLFLPGEKVSLPEALAKIDPCHLAAFLADARDCPLGTEVFDLLDYFVSALSGVSSVEYQYPWPNMNNLMNVIDLPFRHIPEPVFRTADAWIKKVDDHAVCTFIMWSFGWTRDRLAGIPTDYKSELGVFVALSIILRRRPLQFPSILPLLRNEYYHLKNSPEMLPFTVWMMAQVAEGNLWSGLHSWASNLLPLVRDKLKDSPKSVDLILQLIEHVLSHPCAVDIILEDSNESERLFPIPSFEILLPLAFPASFERLHFTNRFEALYPLLKKVALADAPGIEGMKQVTQIFDFSLKFAEQGNPLLAKEATSIAIWCVTKNTKDTERFEAFYPSLKKVALSPALGMEERIQITQHIFACSLKFAGEENHVLAKEATTIAILCLTKNVYCCNRWDKVYMDTPKASVALLKRLVEEWKYHSRTLSSLPSDTRILNLTMTSFVLNNKRGITEGGASASLYKEANKYCKEISRRLSRGNGFLKACVAIAALILVVVLLGAWFYLQNEYCNQSPNGGASALLYKEATKYSKEISRRLSYLINSGYPGVPNLCQVKA